jgi:hypothetical protein
MTADDVFCIFCGRYVPRAEVDGTGKHVLGPLPCHYIAGCLCIVVGPPVLPLVQLPGGQIAFERIPFAAGDDEEIWVGVGRAISGDRPVDEIRQRLGDRSDARSTPIPIHSARILAAAGLVIVALVPMLVRFMEKHAAVSG